MELLVLLLQFALLGMIFAIRRSQKVSPHLPTLLFFMTLMWFTIPVLLTVLLQGHLKIYAFVNYSQFLFFAVMESATLLCTLAFLLLPTPYFKGIINSRLTEIHINSKGALLGILLSIGVSILTAVLMAIFIGTSYFDLNAFFFLSEGSETFNNLGSFHLLQTFLSCFCCACFIHVWPRERQTLWLLIALLIWTIFTVISQAPSGARIAMLQPFFLLTLYCQAQPWSTRQKVTLIGLGGVATVVIGSILAVAIGQARYGDRLNVDDILSSSSKAADENIVNEMAVNLITKFDSFSNSAILVERMGEGRAGIQPYIGAVLALVPRAILPSKPIPGSFDGTIRGYPTRVVAVQMGMSEEAGNVNLSPASITVWQFGYLGLIVMVICNVLHLYLINSLLLSPSLLFKSLAFFLIGLPALLTLYTSPDILLMNLERIFLAFLFLFVLHHVLERRLVRQQAWQQAGTYNNRSYGEA
ncbi:MAG: hypothetical protein JST84_16875 [Acidobacteria bacterium]|nr:hypothetical protein [Acidobacteriota bacterium]